MGSEWIMDIPKRVTSKIKKNFSSALKTKYNMGSENFSTVGSSDKPAVFPFVYIQALTGTEEGRDLEGTAVNGGSFSFQIEVTDNQKQDRAKEVMTEVLRIMKTMRFQIVGLPIYEDTTDIHRCIMRFRRVIGSDDNF